MSRRKSTTPPEDDWTDDPGDLLTELARIRVASYAIEARRPVEAATSKVAKIVPRAARRGPPRPS